MTFELKYYFSDLFKQESELIKYKEYYKQTCKESSLTRSKLK